MNTHTPFWRKLVSVSLSYVGFLIPSFLFVSMLWHLLVEDVLYYCADRAPLLDFFPPFTHGREDHYVASPMVVKLLWYLFVAGLLLLPAGVIWSRRRWLRVAVPVLGLLALSLFLWMIAIG